MLTQLENDAMRSCTRTGSCEVATPVRPISDFAHLRGEEMIAYQIEWEREAKESADWQRVPRDSLDVVGSQAFDELRDVERELAGVTNRVTGLTFQVASARDAGVPPGWVKDEGL